MKQEIRISSSPGDTGGGSKTPKKKPSNPDQFEKEQLKQVKYWFRSRRKVSA